MNAELIPLQQAVVIRGQRAWGKIKATAAEQRQLWREVGEALNYGRAAHPSNKAFGKWCQAQGFDMDSAVRSNAMWFASCTVCNTEIPTDLTHPTHIRQWHRDHTSPALAPEDTSVDQMFSRIAAVSGKERRINATAAHAAEDTPEGETARRQLKAQAKALNMTPDEMVETAQKIDVLNRVAPERKEVLQGVLVGLTQLADLTLAAMKHSPELTTELVITTLYNHLKSKGL